MDIRILAAAACLVAGPAFANCTQANLQGTWNAYTVGVDSDNIIWTKCAITIESNGKLAAASSCTTSSGIKTKVSGSVKLQSAAECTYSGSVKYVANGATAKISEFTLDRDHNTAAGVGLLNGGFNFNMVRF